MWFKVDDKLHDHRKARRAGRAAMGVWVLAASWAADNQTDGFVPADVLPRWGTRAEAARLVAAGLWDTATHHGEQGWRFHDWSRFQPSAAVIAAKKAAEAEAGLRGNHKRWHADRRVVDPDCEYCYRVPDQVPDQVGIGVPESPPTPPEPEPEPTTSPKGDVDVRADVERICQHLADCIAANGSRRPTITKQWRTAARLMLDKDGRTEADVIRAIDWCQTSTTEAALFWRANVLSMPTLRAKYDQMRLQAQRAVTRPTTGGRVAAHLALAQQLAAQTPPALEGGQ